jgi:hypothetical protein
MFGQLLPSKNKIATVPNSVATGIRVPPNPVSKQGPCVTCAETVANGMGRTAEQGQAIENGRGFWALFRCTQKLDFFILFSSYQSLDSCMK